jgi:hypothetical protein
VSSDIHVASGSKRVIVVLDLYDMKKPVDFTITLRYFPYCARKFGPLVSAHRIILAFALVC